MGASPSVRGLTGGCRRDRRAGKRLSEPPITVTPPCRRPALGRCRLPLGACPPELTGSGGTGRAACCPTARPAARPVPPGTRRGAGLKRRALSARQQHNPGGLPGGHPGRVWRGFPGTLPVNQATVAPRPPARRLTGRATRAIAHPTARLRILAAGPHHLRSLPFRSLP